jgi:ribosome maturation protein Sdo1
VIEQNRHGAQGNLDGASKSTLENEFGTVQEDDVIKEILEKGELQESKVRCSGLAIIHRQVALLIANYRCRTVRDPRTTRKALLAVTKEVNPGGQRDVATLADRASSIRC